MPSAQRAFWGCCLLAAPPIAAIAAATGFAMPIADVPRDIATIVAWSVAEEIVFRGALQPWFARHLGQRAALGPLTRGNLATSVVFAAAHLWRGSGVLAMAMLPISLVYGAARDQSGRTWPAASLHTAFNLLLYAASWLRVSG